MKTEIQETYRLKRRHIKEEWSEGHPDQGGDGYWINLRPGFCWAGEYMGGLHVIHEPTKTMAYREEVMVCTCHECLTHREYQYIKP